LEDRPLSSPAEAPSTPRTLPVKPVYYERYLIGHALTWSAVKAMLIARGHSDRQANDIVMTRGVEAPDGFWIITALHEAEFLAELRAVKAGTCKPMLNPPPRPTATGHATNR
jgi:hypothetical protein